MTSGGADLGSDLLDRVAARIAVPRAAEADSFVLHAPLEVLARIRLLRMAAPIDRAAIEDRIGRVADTYESCGPAMSPSSGDEYDHAAARVASGSDDPVVLTADLVRAIDAGDLDGTDAAARALVAGVEPASLPRLLAEPLSPRLGAAAHAPIFLHLLPRTTPSSRVAASMLRPLARELAREPDRQLRWQDSVTPVSPTDWSIVAAVLDVGPVHTDSDFIFPIMHATEQAGVYERQLGPLLGSGIVVADVACALQRLAALSMLQDNPASAPYHWTHALTLTQALASVAPLTSRPNRTIALAASQLVGFRATLGRVRLDPGWTPPHAHGDLDAALVATPPDAASHAWYAPESERAEWWSVLAARAGAHEDAHLAKYTLACHDAAQDDPIGEELFLAASAYLLAWWSQGPG